MNTSCGNGEMQDIFQSQLIWASEYQRTSFRGCEGLNSVDGWRDTAAVADRKLCILSTDGLDQLGLGNNRPTRSRISVKGPHAKLMTVP